MAKPGLNRLKIQTQTVPFTRAQYDNDRLVSLEDIRLCAYHKWEIAGKPTGDSVRFWLEAEQELVRLD
jgi:hypothetical protein